MKSENPFYRLVSPGVTPRGRLFVEINYNDGRLSITGVEGPMTNGDCRGSAGQCGIAEDIQPNTEEGWSSGKIQKLRDIWEKWHLNDMRAGCVHQRKEWDTSKPLELVSYGLTTQAYNARAAALETAAKAAVTGDVAVLTDTERALLSLQKWFSPIFEAPDADSLLSGCYEVKKRETKAAGHVYPTEHPEGLLTKPCPKCGYKYGSAWLKEPVPASVLGFLRRLKDTGMRYNWTRRSA